MAEDSIRDERCPECEISTEFRIEGHEVVCERCGAVVEEIPETPSEREARQQRKRAARQMTVAELREELEQYDDDANVGLWVGRGWNYVGELRLSEADGHPVVNIHEATNATEWPKAESDDS